MSQVGLLLLVAGLATPAYGQAKAAPTGGGQTASAQMPATLTCGVLQAETSRTSSASHWTISGPSGKITESGVLRSGPRFECIEGAILIVEFTSSVGHSFFDAYFPDGTNIGYGRQQIDRRGGRLVLPVQAKTRIAPPYRSAFAYHCRLDMPADPIQPADRADCIF